MLILIFFGILLLSFLVVLLLSRPAYSAKVMTTRLRVIGKTERRPTENDDLILPIERLSGLVKLIDQSVRRFHFADNLRVLIVHAGSTTTVGSVIVFSGACAIAAPLVAHLALGWLPVDIAASLAGACLRWGLLTNQKTRRMKKFDTVLPDAIELMARALRAGHSLSSAIEMVAEQSAEPLASEFAIVFRQQKFGIPFRDAILQLAERVPSKDLHFVVTAILVQKETGGDLTEILDRTTHLIRERMRIDGEVRTYTAQGRLTGWILGGLPIIMLGIINLITPGYSHVLFSDPLGQKLLGTGSALIVIGGLIIRKIVDIQV